MIPIVPSSFGDIVAAITIVHSIYTALSDSNGSSFEYQCLIEELRAFEEALLLVGKTLNATSVGESLHEPIKAETTRCLILLEKFWHRIERYEVVLSRKWTAVWRKISWAIWRAEEVASFRQKLSQHKQNIMIFLTMLQIVITVGGADEARQDRGLMAAKVEDILTEQRRPSTSLGYGPENALILVDAFGERITLPMQFCFSKNELHVTLRRHFEGKIGENLVKRGDYSISSEDGRSIVESDNWDCIVKKGAVLVMSMIIKKPKLHGKLASRQKNACPRCYETNVGVMPDNGWLQCRRCSKRFGCAEMGETYNVPILDGNISDFRNIRIVLVGQLKDVRKIRISLV